MDQHWLKSDRTWLTATAVAFMFALPIPAAHAQDRFTDQAPRAYTASAYDNLQALSERLEAQAERARDEAKIDEHHGGRDEVTERLDDFANHAHELRLLTHERGVPSSRINDQIRKLVDDGHKVQKEWAKSKRINPATQTEWNRTLATLNQLNQQFMAANGLAAPQGVGTSGTFPARAGRRTWTDDRATLLGDLDRRANDAVQLSTDADLDAAGNIQGLRDDLESFHRQASVLSPADAHDRVVRMLSDARAIQRRLGEIDAPAALRDDVSAIVGSLVQMRDMTDDRAVAGTSGSDAPVAIDTDRYATMSPSELWTEMNDRAAASAQIAAQAGLDDVSSNMARFENKLRDFNVNAAGMDRDDRRDRIDSLLHDAQATQRDLARRHASADLVNQWNTVVDLLVRLRDAS